MFGSATDYVWGQRRITVNYTSVTTLCKSQICQKCWLESVLVCDIAKQIATFCNKVKNVLKAISHQRHMRWLLMLSQYSFIAIEFTDKFCCKANAECVFAADLSSANHPHTNQTSPQNYPVKLICSFHDVNHVQTPTKIIQYNVGNDKS